MAFYPLLVISMVLCILVSFSSSSVDLTKQDFKKQSCSTLCTKQKLRDQLKDICIALRNKVHRASEDSYKDDEIRFKCTTDPGIRLKDKKDKLNGETIFNSEIGLCKFSPTEAKCVSKGNLQNTIYYYTYDALSNICYEPTEMDYTFAASSGGGWLSYFAFWKWCG